MIVYGEDKASLNQRPSRTWLVSKFHEAWLGLVGWLSHSVIFTPRRPNSRSTHNAFIKPLRAKIHTHTNKFSCLAKLFYYRISIVFWSSSARNSQRNGSLWPLLWVRRPCGCFIWGSSCDVDALIWWLIRALPKRGYGVWMVKGLWKGGVLRSVRHWRISCQIKL